MRLSLLGVVLMMLGGALGSVRLELSPDELGQLSRLVLDIAGGLNFAFGTILVGQQIVQRKNEESADVVAATEWRHHELQMKRFTADEKIETVTTKSGTAFVQRLKLTSKETGKTAAEFSVVKLYDGAFWKFGSGTELCIGPRRPVRFDQELHSDHIKSLLSNVQYIFCVGLASSAEGSENNSAGLSNLRAMRLVDWLRYSSVMRERDIQLLAAPFGQARTKVEKDSAEERAQRTAILLGITIENELISVNEAMGELVRLTRVEAARLDDYPGALRPISEIL